MVDDSLSPTTDITGGNLPVDRLKWRIAYLLPATVFLFLCILGYLGLFEDAFISFRYAVNLAAGKGLVFNPGEPVWGYSNFLWTVFLAAGLKCGFSLLLFAKLLGVFFALLVLWVSFSWLWTQNRQRRVLVCLVVLLPASSIHLLYAAQNGLETLCFAFLVLVGVLSLIRAELEQQTFPWYAVWFFLASITRPEGPLFILAALLIEVVDYLRCRRDTTKKRLLLALCLFVVPYVLYELAMYFYYGAFFPNAFYVKVDLKHGDGQVAMGLQYVAAFLRDIRAGCLLSPLVFILIDRRRRFENIILVLFLLLYLLFVIRVGGDFQVYLYRFMIPVLPILYLLVGNGLLSLNDLLEKWWRPAYGNLVCGLIAGLLLLVNFAAVRSPLVPFFSPDAGRTPVVVANLCSLICQPEEFVTRSRRWFTASSLDIHPMGTVGRLLAAKLPEGVTVATGQCGQIPYYLQGRKIVDLLGLMDDVVARQGLTEEYFRRQDVDYCIFYYSEESNFFIPLTIYAQLTASKYFRSNFRLEHVYRHRSVFLDRALVSEKYMLLFKRCKTESVGKRAMASPRLREQINDCLARGAFTDLQCNLDRDLGEYVCSEKMPFHQPRADRLFSRVGGKMVRHDDIFKLDRQRPVLVFKEKTAAPNERNWGRIWFFVTQSLPGDYKRLKISVCGRKRVWPTILAAQSLSGIWLPMICDAWLKPYAETPSFTIRFDASAVQGDLQVSAPQSIVDPPWPSFARFIKF